MRTIVERLLLSTSLAACILDRDQRISWANPAASAMFDRSTITGLSVADLVPGATPIVRQCLERAARGMPLPDHTLEVNGRHFLVSFHVPEPETALEGTLLLTALDLTRRVRVETELRESRRRLIATARSDHLTGLLNRRGLEATLHREFRRARRGATPLSLLIIDIDWFKAYNDSFGHQQGDLCIRLVTRALEGCLRRGSDAACRYGGEEFVLILPDTDARGAAIVAANCQQAIAALAIAHPGSPYGRITASIGIVEAQAGGESGTGAASVPIDAAALVDEADRALYRAKQNGRNRTELADTRAAA